MGLDGPGKNANQISLEKQESASNISNVAQQHNSAQTMHDLTEIPEKLHRHTHPIPFSLTPPASPLFTRFRLLSVFLCLTDQAWDIIMDHDPAKQYYAYNDPTRSLIQARDTLLV